MTAYNPALHRFGDVSVRLSVELGRTDMPLREVLALGEGSVVPLNRLTDELLDVTANGRIIAKGEVVTQDGRFALRIVSLAGDDTPGAPAADTGRAKPEVPPLDEAGRDQ
ncbi:FliM/FliN family flagellar motor switch protein [Erythrobacter sp. JK5]|uniref:FliM/FliN family flagellar motor switch protein n=1 Tax=Erythrobacter sp. JK5 TaxID=2829500 RepID=UPI001BA4A642|nr:FliM/FliN family flagellar motor switch protein [Erythrobacter sp. JK5]QUL36909.1 FliM/FliN family flagellar motor switch protein [Erythrobacter sp. JK5]